MNDFNPLDLRKRLHALGQYSIRELKELLDTSEKIHVFALQYDWEDGNAEFPRWVINHPECDRGTALMLYWRAGPRFFCQFSHRGEVPSRAVDYYDLIKEIEQKYLNGFYTNCAILFNPRYDTTVQQDGYDYLQEYDELPQKSTIPLEMIDPSISDPEWEALGKPIRPIRRVDYSKIERPDVGAIVQRIDANKGTTGPQGKS